MHGDLLPGPRQKGAEVADPRRKEQRSVVKPPGNPQVQHQGVREHDDRRRSRRAAEFARGPATLGTR